MAELRAPRGLGFVLSRWQPIAGVLAAIVVVNLAVYVGVIRSVVRLSGNRHAILATQQERVTAVRSELDALERTSSKLACVESDVQHVFEVQLSSKMERMTAIQREVRKLARDRGLDPDRITYGATAVKDSGLVRFTIAFPLEGAYDTLQGFIQAVEASPNFLIVQGVSIQEAQGSSLKLQIELVTYFQDPDAGTLEAAFPALAGGRT